VIDFASCNAFLFELSSDKQSLSNCQLSLAVEAACQLVALTSDGITLLRREDLDVLDGRFLAPAAGSAFGQRTAFHPFSVGARRDALGPKLARRVRGEVDHNAMRVDVLLASALARPAGGIGGLERSWRV
jgi:hypothetical protein